MSMHQANIEWLRAMWRLPEPAVQSVVELLDEELRGSTACELTEEPTEWGEAASAPGDELRTPLLLVRQDGKTFLQSRRLFLAEQEIARELLGMVGREIPAVDGAATRLNALFPGVSPDDPQLMAARTSCENQLSLITGGPGTGKTYTLARILASCLADGTAPDQIRLAAPTGKAADRMRKAVIDSLDALPKAFQTYRDSLDRVAKSSSTIHSLLGYNPGSGLTRFGKTNPLRCSVLILDECSMVDLLLWQAILQAVPGTSRLILLGDPNQLESVGQGNVFAELARNARRPGSALGQRHVHLANARRFKDKQDIVALAKALEDSDPDACAALLEGAQGPPSARGLSWIPSTGGILPCDELPATVHKALENVAKAASPGEALDAIGRVCILTAQREFFIGSKATSAAIDAQFSKTEGVRNHPIIINRNDPETGLRNGAVGVIHSEDDGCRRAYFPSSGSELRDFALGRLPDYSPAWAITIHRSQGSEYDEVLVVLPREESPMVTRELLYTAITRAKSHVYVVGDLASIRKAAQTPSRRITLLQNHLQRGMQSH